MDLDNAFLTEVEVKSKRFQDPKLAGVRKDYVRVMETVEAFGDKVNNMVDKQRDDYMHAYEKHMYDVQKELHSLREKVTEIANDKTRDEKIKQLSTDQIKYRHEALDYDQQSAKLRKKIKTLKETLNSVERERDWLLKKLRDEKRRYNFLKDERLKYGGAIADSNSSMTSVASDSSFSIELLHDRSVLHAVAATGKKRSSNSDWRNRLENDIQAVNRDPAMISTLPLLVNPNVLSEPSPTMYPSQQYKSPIKTGSKSTKKRILAELVTLRARQEGIRDFVSHCVACCGRGVWTKKTQRPLSDLLMLSVALCNNPDSSYEDRMTLIKELALQPETYQAISQLITGKSGPHTQTAVDPWGMFGNTSEEFVENYDIDQDQQALLDNDLEGDDGEWMPLDLDQLDAIEDGDDNEAAIAVLRINDPLYKDRNPESQIRSSNNNNYSSNINSTGGGFGSNSTSMLPPIKQPNNQKQSNASLAVASAAILDTDTLAYFKEMQEQVRLARASTKLAATMKAEMEREEVNWLQEDRQWE